MVITDGRWNYLRDALASAKAHLPRFDGVVLVDDSAPERIQAECLTAARELGPLTYVRNGERQGLAGAIRAGWETISDTDFVFHLEDDFVFTGPVPVDDMVAKLEKYPQLAQVALLRQPWSPEEHRAGGIYGMDPEGYTERDGLVWHDKLFTFNPSVYPSIVTEYGAGLEAEVTDTLRDKGYRFAFYGTRDDGPRCWHIGVRRSAGYRW